MDYKNGKIYTIRSHQTDKFYIGSTTQPLSKRFHCHKSKYKNYLDGKTNYITSFDIIKYGDAYIELLEAYPCDNKMMLLKREGECIRAEPNCVNKFVAGRTQREYKIDNADKIKEIQKKYQKQNADKVKEYQKQYKEQNSDKVKEYQKEYSKQYRDQNVDKIKQYKKQYREQNADKIKEQKKKYRENKKEMEQQDI